jgi:hypothetical protein
MLCRVCLLNVKKSAVLCAQCSLIAHSKCAINAPPTCDLRAQLLLYAKYAEKGHPASVYSNPTDGLRDLHPSSPASDVPYVAHSTGSIGAPSPPPLIPTPPALPIAHKLLGALKRSRSNLFPEPHTLLPESLEKTKFSLKRRSPCLIHTQTTVRTHRQAIALTSKAYGVLQLLPRACRVARTKNPSIPLSVEPANSQAVFLFQVTPESLSRRR